MESRPDCARVERQYRNQKMAARQRRSIGCQSCALFGGGGPEENRQRVGDLSPSERRHVAVCSEQNMATCRDWPGLILRVVWRAGFLFLAAGSGDCCSSLRGSGICPPNG